MPEFPSAASEKLDVARYACVFLLCRMKIHSALLVQLFLYAVLGLVSRAAGMEHEEASAVSKEKCGKAPFC